MSDLASDSGLIIDSFAGGGGASLGIERALGRSPDIAINHDPDALAMHAANHPRTLHLTENVWKVDTLAVTCGRPVFLLHASPDCRHHSRAKGGAPVSRSVRGLADVVILWARLVAPHIITLENVEEFQDWGPLTADGTPCPVAKGAEFARWVRALEALGYAVAWRSLRACDYGAPTIRRRLFLVARRDGRPILWPARTHGDPKKDADAIARGELKPWRTAAEIIDWSLPCPSIFITKAEAKAAGLSVVRPLADKTMARIARGFQRYVLERAKPFVVVANHGGEGFRGQGVDAPFATVCRSRDAFGVVAPHLMTMRNAGKPFMAADEPAHTVTAGGAALCAVSGFLVPRYGERAGQQPRAISLKAPSPTIVPSGNGGDLAAVYLAQHNGNGVIGRDAAEPVSTLMTGAAQQQPVLAYLAGVGGRMGQSGERPVDAPYHTVCTKPDTVVVLPHLTAYYGTGDGNPVDEPIRTATTHGRFGHVEAHAGAPPLADWQIARAHQVAAFLRAQGVWTGEGPFVTVGAFVVWDIGMRMLTPRELARAQGFPDDYDITAGGRLTETAQRHKIGNSVCPDVQEALIRANAIAALAWPRVRRKRAPVRAAKPQATPAPSFLDAAE